MTDRLVLARAQAQVHLMELLDPQTPAQRRTVIWLLDWDTDTLENLAAMIVQARG
jgi:hypothetical protein